MVKINRIYTRTGDKGTTALVGGKRVKKNSLRVTCYGEVDELNSYLGWARTLAERDLFPELGAQLSTIQNELFDLGAYLASPAEGGKVALSIEEQTVLRLEKWIDQATNSLPELRSFVLPGGSELNSALHIARAVCRRVERRLLDLMESEAVNEQALVYVNRLSDFLFAASRLVLAEKSIPEYLWVPGKK